MKIIFVFVTALLFASCGSNNVVADVATVYNDATEKIKNASSYQELEYIEFEMMCQLYDLYKLNKEDCDLIAENLNRYQNDNDFELKNAVDLNKFIDVFEEYDKELDKVVDELADDKNIRDYNEFNEYMNSL